MDQNKLNALKLKLKNLNNVKITTKKAYNEINLFELGTLIQFETASYQARKTLPKDLAMKLTPKQKTDWVGASKRIIDKSHLFDINKIISDARQYIESISNPFPIKGIHFVPNEKVKETTDKLNEFITLFKEKVNFLAENYEQCIIEAEEILSPDGLFNVMDYPSDIKSKFKMQFRFFELTIPSSLTDQVYKEEQEKFITLANETREMGILALRNGFAEIITHLTNKLSGKLDGEKLRLHQESINKIEEFWESFQFKNVFKDDELKKTIQQARDIFVDIDAKDLRKDEELIKAVHEEMEKVKDTLDKSIKTFKRKVSFI